MPRFLPLVFPLLCCSGSVAAQDDFRSGFLRPFEYSAHRLNALAALVQLLAHMNEHVGQAIVYARINGVFPPWSR